MTMRDGLAEAYRRLGDDEVKVARLMAASDAEMGPEGLRFSQREILSVYVAESDESAVIDRLAVAISKTRVAE